MPNVDLGSTTMAGSATVTAGLTPDRALLAAVLGLATLTSGFTPERQLGSTFAGAATFTSGFTPNRPLSMTATGAASVIAALMGNETEFATLGGDSSFSISPTGVIIAHFGRAAIPSTAKPPTVPQLRISPPSPAGGKYTVNPKPPRKPQG